MRGARVGDADDLDAGQVGEHAGMVAAHDPDPDHAQPTGSASFAAHSS